MKVLIKNFYKLKDKFVETMKLVFAAKNVDD